MQSEGGTLTLIHRAHWLCQPNDEQESFETPIYKPNTESLHELYVRTIAADVLMDDEKEHEVRFPRSREEVDDISHEAFTLAEAMSTRIERRVFAVSMLGFLALGPDETHNGDLIAIVQGSGVPLILRPSGHAFSLIGQAYVHGMMGGELLGSSDDTKCFRKIRVI